MSTFILHLHPQGVFSFWEQAVKMTGLEGDRAERSEVKTSQCDVFRESDKPIVWLITRRI